MGLILFRTNISTSGKKQCLTIDTREVNGLRATKFITQADNNKGQICYYNKIKRDKNFNCFLAVRKQTSSSADIIFSIVNLIDKTNKNDNIYFEINSELKDFNNDNVQYKRPIQRICGSNIEFVKVTLLEKHRLTEATD